VVSACTGASEASGRAHSAKATATARRRPHLRAGTRQGPPGMKASVPAACGKIGYSEA